MVDLRHTDDVSRPSVGEGRIERTWGGLALVSLAGILWGTIGPGVVLIHDASGLAPLSISAYRAVFAVVVLLAFSFATGRFTRTWSSARHEWRRVVTVGVLTALFQMLFFVAVLLTGVSVTTVVCLGFAPCCSWCFAARRNGDLPRPGAACPSSSPWSGSSS